MKPKKTVAKYGTLSLIPWRWVMNSAVMELEIGNRDSLASMSSMKEADDTSEKKKKIEDESKESVIDKAINFPFL